MLLIANREKSFKHHFHHHQFHVVEPPLTNSLWIKKHFVVAEYPVSLINMSDYSKMGCDSRFILTLNLCKSDLPHLQCYLR